MESAEKVLDEAGVEVVGTAQYDEAALDLSGQLGALKAKNPEDPVLFEFGVGSRADLETS